MSWTQNAKSQSKYCKVSSANSLQLSPIQYHGLGLFFIDSERTLCKVDLDEIWSQSNKSKSNYRETVYLMLKHASLIPGIIV